MNKAQSEVIGIVLLLAISMMTIGMILAFGQPILSSTTSSLDFDRMENEFSVFDAKIGTAVLGSSETQRINLNLQGGQIVSVPDESYMKITYNDGVTSTVLGNITMGYIEYRHEEGDIAFEGGGVWRSLDRNHSAMISPPEFYYRGATLTVPTFNITDNISAAGSQQSLSVRAGSKPEILFPDNTFDNPLDKGNVTVKVKSKYYKGWVDFFRERTRGSIRGVHHNNDTVIIELTVPTTLDIVGGLMYEDSYGVKGSASVEDPTEVTVPLPPPKEIFTVPVDACPGNPDCVNLDSLSDGDTLNPSKIYYHNGDYEWTKDLWSDTSNGNVTILIDGSLVLQSSDLYTEPVDPSNSNETRMYIEEGLGFKGNAMMNWEDTGGNPQTNNSTRLSMYVNGEFPGDGGAPGAPGSGTAEIAGVIYAPNTNHGGCSGPSKITGTLNLKGSIIANNFCISGNTDIDHGDVDKLDLTGDISVIKFLHITENKVRLRD